MRKHRLDGESLSVDTVYEVATSSPDDVEVHLSEDAIKKMERSRRFVEHALSRGTVIYGVTTGFGGNADKAVDVRDARILQRKLIESHCCGVGDGYGISVVRAAMLIRANSLAKGLSGVRPQVVDLLCAALNRGVTPFVPSYGSVGASGDLAPLAHMAIVLTAPPEPEKQQREKLLAAKARSGNLSPQEREECLISGGLAFYWDGGWRLTNGIESMARAGIERLVLEAKEGLAFVNGTAFSAALGCIALARAEVLLSAMEKGVALAAEAMRCFTSAWCEEVMEARPQKGQKRVAKRLRQLLHGSELIRTLKAVQSEPNPLRRFGAVQDPYSLRCVPQVLGVLDEALPVLRRILTTEINSASDNPLLFLELPYQNKAVSSGNFHAQLVGWGLYCLRGALVGVVNLVERLVALLLDAKTNRGLPAFLTPNSGLNSGLMLLQYTAADLTAECRAIAATTAHSIPTSAGQEDVVPMTPLSGKFTLKMLENCANLAAILALCAYQATFFRLKEAESKTAKLGKGTTTIYERFSKVIPPVTEDRPLWRDVATARRLLGLWQREHSLDVQPF